MDATLLIPKASVLRLPEAGRLGQRAPMPGEGHRQVTHGRIARSKRPTGTTTPPNVMVTEIYFEARLLPVVSAASDE
jgi:hypothetical protein